ncbi:GNAT family N-acetyltransferase [Neptunomonas phycophila]|uniref:GNAT family N-acetyltransferase n=2 Tax=Oceanospirillaceae TaxID=135620 RepID=A0AAW7XJS0_9GAMM|nr:GNAT family N-acetyltransferase [Neptunomonas phycophila]MDO6453961.1 GNAT family N-acetyltransferase [Neptunomonas phycophila]
MAEGKWTVVDILKASSKHADSIQVLLDQLGYRCNTEEVISAIDSSEPNSDLFVAVSRGKVIGFMSLIYFFYFPLQKQNCRITSLVVDEYARGNGVGKRLIDHALEKAKSLSCAQLEVTTSLTREATQAYYERSGFIKSSFRYYLDLGI